MYRLILGYGLTYVAPKRVFRSSHNERKNDLVKKSLGYRPVGDWHGNSMKGKERGNIYFPSFPVRISCALPSLIFNKRERQARRLGSNQSLHQISHSAFSSVPLLTLLTEAFRNTSKGSC